MENVNKIDCARLFACISALVWPYVCVYVCVYARVCVFGFLISLSHVVSCALATAASSSYSLWYSPSAAVPSVLKRAYCDFQSMT